MERSSPATSRTASQIIDAPGGPWLILSLEFGPRDAALAWADRIVKRYSSLPAIVVTHAYLYADDTRYDHRSRPGPALEPLPLSGDARAGAVNDGEEIWRKLVVGTTTSSSCSAATISTTASGG